MLSSHQNESNLFGRKRCGHRPTMFPCPLHLSFKPMPLETLEQPNIRELITDRPEKRPYIFNPDKDITAADWELMLPDLPKDLQSGAWISILDPQRTALLDNEHWLGQAFNRAGWAN